MKAFGPPHPTLRAPTTRGDGSHTPAARPLALPGMAELLTLPAPPMAADHQAETLAALGAGAAGKVGWADLRLAAVGGRTRLVHADARVPYQVGRLHTRADLGDRAHLYLTMPTGGLLQGDRTAVRVMAEPGVRARLTTPAATKIYGMRANYASQAIQLTAGPGAWLEWWPEPTIPYRGARYQQRTTLTAALGAVLLWGEVLLPGRLARDERHAYDWLALDLEIRDEGGALIVADRQRYVPSRRPLDVPGRLRDWPVLTSAFLLAPGQELARLEEAIGDTVDQFEGVLAGVSVLPGQAGLVVRGLAATSHDAAVLMTRVNDLAVRHLAAMVG